MATSAGQTIAAELRKVMLRLDPGADLTDGELLELFIHRHDEAAFAALVKRHGPMVLGVCRRVLGNLDDSEDAFQATFLLLVRKAGSIAPRDMVGNWLHGVACRTAQEARRLTAKRRIRERAAARTEAESPEPIQDWQLWLDRELQALPDKYRVPILLCDLRGQTHKEAARQLRCPEGTLSGRLARGRALLARRLAHRGVAVSAGGLALLLSHGAASAAMSQALAATTVHAACLFAGGQTTVVAATSTTIAALTQGVLRTMFMSKLQTVAVYLVAVVLLCGGLGLVWSQAPGFVAADPGQQPADKNQRSNDDQPGKNDQRGKNNQRGAADGAKNDKPAVKSDKIEGFTKIELSGGQFLIRQTGKESVQETAENIEKAKGPAGADQGRGPGGPGADRARGPGSDKPRGPGEDKPKSGDAEKAKGEVAGKVEKWVENGTLHVKGGDKKVVIEVKELTGLTVGGGSDVELVDIKSKQLDVKIQGFGAVKLAGNVDDQTVDILGRGTFDGEACKGKQGKVSTKGSANVVINVTDKLTVNAIGNGTVEYIGSPKVEQNAGMGVTVSQKAGDPVPDDPAAIAAAQAAAKKPWFDSAGVPIHYIVTGKEDGEPVLLIHGFASSIEVQWAPVIDALKKDYKVIAMDIRGCGGSGKPHDPKKYGKEMTNDVLRLLDHLKIEKAHIVGYSMSSGTALLFTRDHPKRVLTLSCCGAGVISFGSNTPPGNLPNPNMFPRNPGQAQLLTDLANALDNNSVEPLTIRLTPENQPKPTPEQIKAHDKALMAVNDNKALAAMIRSCGYKDTRITEKEIQDISVPTLAIVGADDTLKFGVDKLKKLLPRTKVVVIEKAHHLDAYKKPEFVTALKQFLDDNRQAGKK